jgi:hypothetical protein
MRENANGGERGLEGIRAQPHWGEGEDRSCTGRRREASAVAAARRGGGRQARRRNAGGGGLRAAVQGLADGGVGQAKELDSSPAEVDLAANDGTEVDAMAGHPSALPPPPWRSRGGPTAKGFCIFLYLLLLERGKNGLRVGYCRCEANGGLPLHFASCCWT